MVSSGEELLVVPPVGRRSVVSLEALLALADAAGVSPSRVIISAEGRDPGAYCGDVPFMIAVR